MSCPDPNPAPECNGTLVPVYHPVTNCLIGYNCLDPTTPAPTTTRPPESCAVADKNCFRGEQRTRRVRAAPQPSPYEDYSESTTTTTTTTVTTQPPYPPEYLSVIQTPDSTVVCPAIEEPVPPMYFDAFGGDEVVQVGEYLVHKFYNEGIFQIIPYNFDTFVSAEIEFLLVGGGGSGGLFVGGGGGGGGEVKRSKFPFPAGAFVIEIGEGGFRGSKAERSSIVSLGINANGGGAGGQSFDTNWNATGNGNGGNGGGAGGRSNSQGGLAYGGNGGGSSFSQFGIAGGGGGGGAGFSGENAPVLADDGETVLAPAGRGGGGKAVTFDGKTYNYYGGGGAGSDYEGFVIERSNGGGGGTISKDGLPNTGGGGAGNGGVGGKGYCEIAYIPVTTPAPTTTTTRPPTVPDPVEDVGFTVSYDSVGIGWSEPSDVGTAPISAYQIIVTNVLLDQIVYNLSFDPTTTNTNVEDLDPEVEYSFDIFAINSVGRSDPVSFTATTVTTTTTTTTIDPNGVSFIIDFQSDTTNCFIGNDSVTINGPDGTIRNTLIQVIAFQDKFFYDVPEVLLFGDGVPDIQADGIQINISPDRTYVNITIPVRMPDRPETRSLVFITASAIDAPEPSTTTTTTTLPPLCLSLYDKAEFVYDEDEDKYIPPTDEERFLRPLQFFFWDQLASDEAYKIIGTILPDSTRAANPWYGGKYFEQSRPVTEVEDYIEGLPRDYNKYLLLSTNEDGTQEILTTNKYILEYPEVRGDNSINTTIIRLLEESVGYRLELKIVLDYTCNLSNVLPDGRGDEDISGFFSMEIRETYDNTTTILFDQIFQNNMDFRITNNFTSQYSRNNYVFMCDFGTREGIPYNQPRGTIR